MLFIVHLEIMFILLFTKEKDTKSWLKVHFIQFWNILLFLLFTNFFRKYPVNDPCSSTYHWTGSKSAVRKARYVNNVTQCGKMRNLLSLERIFRENTMISRNICVAVNFSISSLYGTQCTVWKNEKFTLTEIIFRQTNCLETLS